MVIPEDCCPTSLVNKRALGEMRNLASKNKVDGGWFVKNEHKPMASYMVVMKPRSRERDSDQHQERVQPSKAYTRDIPPPAMP